MKDKTVTIKSVTDDSVLVAGYGVVWGDRDLYGDTFTRETDLGLKSHPMPPAYYDHTLSGVEEEIGKTIKMSPNETGLWVEQELDRHNEYMDAILKLIEAGALGYSSGSAEHLVRREGSIIKKWPIVDISLTPTPAEPRTLGVQRLKAIAEAHPELKALLPQDAGDASASGETAEPTPTTTTSSGGAAMAEEIKQAPEINVEALVKEAVNASVSAALKAYREQLAAEPPLTPKGMSAVAAETKDPNDHGPFKSFGEQLMAVKAAYTPGAPRDERLYAVKATGLNEGIGSEGGFLVQQDFAGNLLNLVHDTSAILPRVRKVTISSNSNGAKINLVDETSRANGSRWGGVQVYWASEAGTATASKPKFRQMILDLKKLMGFYYATDEELADASLLESVANQAFAEEFDYVISDGVIRGTGAGQLLGVLNSGALVTVSKETGQAADTVVYNNVRKMWNRLWSKSRSNAVWYIHQDVEEQLQTMNMPVGTGGVPVYLPPGGASTTQYSSLFGRPVIQIEQADTVGDLGDIILMDPTQYLMAEKGGLQTASSIHVAFLYGEQTFRFVYRVDGQPLWNSVLTPANSSNTVSPFVALAARA